MKKGGSLKIIFMLRTGLFLTANLPMKEGFADCVDGCNKGHAQCRKYAVESFEGPALVIALTACDAAWMTCAGACAL